MSENSGSARGGLEGRKKDAGDFETDTREKSDMTGIFFDGHSCAHSVDLYFYGVYQCAPSHSGQRRTGSFGKCTIVFGSDDLWTKDWDDCRRHRNGAV